MDQEQQKDRPLRPDSANGGKPRPQPRASAKRAEEPLTSSSTTEAEPPATGPKRTSVTGSPQEAASAHSSGGQASQSAQATSSAAAAAGATISTDKAFPGDASASSASAQPALGGHSSPSAHRAQAQASMIQRVIIIWDSENVPLGRAKRDYSQPGPDGSIFQSLFRPTALVDEFIKVAGQRSHGEDALWADAHAFRSRGGRHVVHMVVPHKVNPWLPEELEREALLDAGVYLIDAGRKKDYVDVVVKKLLRHVAEWEDPNRTAVLLISGDRDYADELGSLRERCFQQRVMLHNGCVRPSVEELMTVAVSGWTQMRERVGLDGLPDSGDHGGTQWQQQREQQHKEHVQQNAAAGGTQQHGQHQTAKSRSKSARQRQRQKERRRQRQQQQQNVQDAEEQQPQNDRVEQEEDEEDDEDEEQAEASFSSPHGVAPAELDTSGEASTEAGHEALESSSFSLGASSSSGPTQRHLAEMVEPCAAVRTGKWQTTKQLARSSSRGALQDMPR